MPLNLRKRISSNGFTLVLALGSSVVETHDPDELFSADEVAICRVRIEDLRDLLTPRLLVLSLDLLPFGSNGSWPWVKLRNVENWEPVAFNKVTSLLVMLRCLSWEATDDVSSKGHCWHLIAQEVTHLVELLNCVLPVHLVEDVIRTALNGNVQELVYARVLHDVSHGLKVFQDVGWVRHPEP